MPGYKDNINGKNGQLLHPPPVPAMGQIRVGRPDVPEDQWTATLTVVPRAVPCTDAEFNEMFAAKPAPTPNPYGGNNLIRLQGTWGAHSYVFGQQESVRQGSIEEAPELVRRCLAAVRERCGAFGVVYDKYDWFCHFNLYTAEAALAPHQDSEALHAAGVPIFSFVFVSPGTDATQNYRYFVVQQGPGTVLAQERQARCWPVPLKHGDMAVMAGTFQKDVYHGVPKASTAAKRSGARRINITIRATAKPAV